MINKSKRCWVEIDLSQIEKNLAIYKENIPSNMDIIAVIKADAYGHGDVAVAKSLMKNGVRCFAVSNIDEAIRVRKAGINGLILILGYTPIDRTDDLVEFNLTQTLLSEQYMEELAKCGKPLMCQFAIDTGMRRIGLNSDDPDLCEYIIRNCPFNIKLTGLFTHLCTADTDAQKSFTEMQIRKFEEIVSRVSDLNLQYCHCMNSAGGLWHKSVLSCYSRLGIILYGLKPDYLNSLPCGIKPALSWKSVVSMVKTVNKGDTVGYGRSYVVEHPMTIATVPTGYADGYSRSLSNRGWVLIDGCKAPIVGRICMDQMMIDVSGIENVEIGTEVTLIGESKNETITADEIAHLYGTIGYEVVCGISKRVDREYV